MVGGEKDVFVTHIEDLSGSVNSSRLGRIYKINLIKLSNLQW